MGIIALYLWDTFRLWLHTIFVAPWQNFDMLWVLLAIYLGWIFADFFQEKRGTSLGNAISNGVVALWAGIDWIRAIFRAYSAGLKITPTELAGKLVLAAFVLFYGLMIIYYGIKAKPLTKYIGRIREVTYVLIIFTPVIYSVTLLDFRLLLGTIIFFPIFYYFVELLDHFIPDPQSIKEDLKLVTSQNLNSDAAHKAASSQQPNARRDYTHFAPPNSQLPNNNPLLKNNQYMNNNPYINRH